MFITRWKFKGWGIDLDDYSPFHEYFIQFDTIADDLVTKSEEFPVKSGLLQYFKLYLCFNSTFFLFIDVWNVFESCFVIKMNIHVSKFSRF